jgi:nucleoside-diphosphate-sugar epimerase
MNVCVVGATGVLGRALVPLLVSQGHSVRALSRFITAKETLFPREVECRYCDLLANDAPGTLPSLLDSVDAVIHAATQIPRDFDAPGAWEANTKLRTDGTRRLLEACLKAGVSVYIQQSNAMSYPDMGDRWITEDVPLDSSPPRASRTGPVIALENIVRAVSGESIRWCILRGGLFVGKGTKQEETINRIRMGEEVLAGDGTNYISLIHFDDFAAAVAAALQYGPPGSTFNINAEPLRQREYAHALARLFGAHPPRRDQTKPNPPSYRCSNARARKELHWEPRRPIYPTVSITVDRS